MANVQHISPPLDSGVKMVRFSLGKMGWTIMIMKVRKEQTKKSDAIVADDDDV